MKFNETLVHSMVVYASIFPNRVGVLDHMFGAYGTGYEWYRGELIEIFPSERSRRRELKNIRRFFREEFNTGKKIRLLILKGKHEVILDNNIKNFTEKDKDRVIRELYLDISEYREMENVYTIIEEQGKEYVLVPDDIQERLDDRNYSDWHTIHTEYAPIMAIPDNIKSDWLNAAFEYLTLLLGSNVSVKSPSVWRFTCKSVEKGQIEADRINKHNHRIGKRILKSLERRFPSHKFKFNKTPNIVMGDS